MKDPFTYPKLRWPLDVGTDVIEGEQIVYVRCPLGISPAPLVLKAAIGPVLIRLDGTKSCDDVITEFQSAGLTKGLLKELIDLLELHCFLDSPRFYAEQKKIQTEFLANPIREPSMAGSGYARTRSELTRQLEGYMDIAGIAEPSRDYMQAIVAPHIDFRRGHACYGKTYRTLRSQAHDVYLLMGTAHQYSKHVFHLTSKDFGTPFGILKTDKHFVSALAMRYGEDRSYADELLHKREHSLELQTPFLAMLQPDAMIVPILIGSFFNFIRSGKYPEEHQVYQSFIEPLAEQCGKLIESGKKVCVVSGVDMAHVGQNFGDKEPLSPETMEQIADRDRQYLEAITTKSKHALFDHIAEDSDARRICGYPTLYLMLDLFERLNLRSRVEVLDYSQAVDYQTDCAVTYAGLAFYDEGTGSLAV